MLCLIFFFTQFLYKPVVLFIRNPWLHLKPEERMVLQRPAAAGLACPRRRPSRPPRRALQSRAHRGAARAVEPRAPRCSGGGAGCCDWWCGGCTWTRRRTAWLPRSSLRACPAPLRWPLPALAAAAAAAAAESVEFRQGGRADCAGRESEGACAGHGPLPRGHGRGAHVHAARRPPTLIMPEGCGRGHGERVAGGGVDDPRTWVTWRRDCAAILST